MSGASTLRLGAAQAIGQTRFEARAATRETPLVKWLILGTALTFFAVFLLMPLIAVFVEALRKGWETYLSALIDPDALSALRLTLLATWCSACARRGRSPSSSSAASTS